jgi:hypothetical protein
VDVNGDVVVEEGIGIVVVSKGLILASVGLVQPAKSTQTMSTDVVKRNMVHFMKNAFDFFILLISASGVLQIISTILYPNHVQHPDPPIRRLPAGSRYGKKHSMIESFSKAF